MTEPVKAVEPSRSKKYRLFFIGYVSAWFFAGIAIELIKPWRLNPAPFALRLKPPPDPAGASPA